MNISSSTRGDGALEGPDEGAREGVSASSSSDTLGLELGEFDVGASSSSPGDGALEGPDEGASERLLDRSWIQ